MNKTKLIAVCGLCCAVAVCCLAFTGFVSWLAFALAVLAGVAVAIPVIVDARYVVYSLLTWISASVLGLVLSVGKLYFVVPVVFFAMPFTICKCFFEAPRSTDCDNETVVSDPFDCEKTVALLPNTRPRLKTVLRYVVYYAVLQVALVLTALSMHLFAPQVWNTLLQKGSIWWLLAAVELAVFPYDFFMGGVLKIVRNAVKKSFRN